MTHGVPLDRVTVLFSTMPRWIGLAITLPFVFQIASRVPLTPLRASVIALHLALLLTISISHAALDSWAVAYRSPEFGIFFGVIPRFMRSWYNTLPTVVTTYAAVLFAAWGMSEARERQRRTLRASQLEAQLQSARLAALRAQLQPHFLYNTLNGIAALVADAQPKRAVAAIEQLSELLHASLRDDGREEITVEEEVMLAERYLALQRMRFGDRLQYEWYVEPTVAECLVPVLLLQPVVENAVVHGLDAGQPSLHVCIRAAARGGDVEITVENDGIAGHLDARRPTSRGVGLTTTRARLLTVHGDRASLTLHRPDDGGAIVRVILPRRIVHRARTPLDVEALGAAT